MPIRFYSWWFSYMSNYKGNRTKSFKINYHLNFLPILYIVVAIPNAVPTVWGFTQSGIVGTIDDSKIIEQIPINI